MIVFRQKEYSEYDATRMLYMNLRQNNIRVDVIEKSELIPILKGNSVVIEKFVVASQLFGKDKFRTYIKVGSKAKFPDKVRIPGGVDRNRIPLFVSMEMNGRLKPPKDPADGGGGKKKNNNDNTGISWKVSPNVDISTESQQILSESIKVNKDTRSMILESSSLVDAIRALSLLPFGLNYHLYLLNA